MFIPLREGLEDKDGDVDENDPFANLAMPGKRAQETGTFLPIVFAIVDGHRRLPRRPFNPRLFLPYRQGRGKAPAPAKIAAAPCVAASSNRAAWDRITLHRQE